MSDSPSRKIESVPDAPSADGQRPVEIAASKLSPAGTNELWLLSAGLCNGTLTVEQRDRLEAWIAADEQVRDICSLQLQLHAMLRWRFRPLSSPLAAMEEKPATSETSCETGGCPDSCVSQNAAVPFGIVGAVETKGDCPDFCASKNGTVPFRIPLGALGTAWHRTGRFLSDHEYFTGNLVATLFFAVAALIGSNVYVSTPEYSQYFAQHERQYDDSPQPARGYPQEKEKEEKKEEQVAVWVGQITGKVDCVWANNKTAPVWHKFGMNDKFELKSGLVEITYYSGAKVILQGPCTYEVDSASGGYLSLGKLTARVEKKVASGQWPVASESTDKAVASGQWPVASENTESRNPEISKSPNPSSPATNHQPLATNLFAVRTPTAVVTDLGTEFGVEVSDAGATLSHVFDGFVTIAAQIDGQQTSAVMLSANQSARVNRQQNGLPSVVVDHSEGKISRFPRAMPPLRHFAKIVNASFEAPCVAKENEYVRLRAGMDAGWRSDTWDNCGVHRFLSGFYFFFPDQSQVGFLNHGTIWQQLDERLAPNSKYTLAIWMGNRLGELNPDYTIELFAGNTILISKINPVMPVKGKFEQATLTFVTSDAHPALGERLKIVLRSNGGLNTHTQNHFDNVRLEVTRVDVKYQPNPSFQSQAKEGGEATSTERVK